jgi:hypothetical protein
MINGFIQCWFARLSTLQNIHSDVLNQKTSLVVHIRDVVNKFVQGEIVKKNYLERFQNRKEKAVENLKKD